MKKFVVQIFNLIIISFLLNNQALAHHTSDKNFGLKVFGERKDIYEKYCTNRRNIEPYYQKIKKDGNATTKKRAENDKLIHSPSSFTKLPISTFFIPTIPEIGALTLV